MSVRNAAHSVTKRQFAETFGISEAQLERLFQQGMPHQKGKKREIEIPMPAGRVWYHQYLVDKGRKEVERRDPSDRKHTRNRRELAETELVELDLAKARGELMRVEDFRKLVGDAFARVRARLQNLPPRAAGQLVGAETIQEAQARIEPFVREIMEELRRADDIPEVVEEEAAVA